MNLRYKLHSGKNSNFRYFLRSYLGYVVPKSLFRARLEGKLREFDSLDSTQQQYVMERVEYYCKLAIEKTTPLGDKALMLADHTLQNREYPSTYFFDSYEFTRFFDDKLLWNYIFADVIHVPDRPTIVKSRPLCEGNQNSVLLNLDKNRHFVRLNDKIPFEKKDNIAIFRGDISGKPQRRAFVERFIDSPMCDVGDVTPNSKSPIEWHRPLMSLYDHLTYKFIFALEGNDVASNLKWIMSSNSVAVMPQPTCETWFMEGKLRGGEHFIEIEEDFSNVESQLQYYIDHPREAVEIATAAKHYLSQFEDKRCEELISLMVLHRYFVATAQI